MENEFKGLLNDVREAIYRKQWDEVRRLYDKYKDSIPPLDVNVDLVSKEDFERLKQDRGLHILVETYCGKDRIKNSIAILFRDAYPYMMGWYE